VPDGVAGAAPRRGRRQRRRAPVAEPSVRGGLLVRLVVLVAGLLLFALGIVMTLQSDLGLGPWDVLHQGLAEHTPLTFGQAGIAAGVVVLAAAVALGVLPGPGTVLNVILIGVFLDALIALDVVPSLAGEPLPAKLLLDVAGVLAVGVGTALYIGARMGAGPRDSLMLGLSRRLGLRVGLARSAVEVAAFAGGAALGGTYGAGTIIFALGVGPAIETSFRALARSPLAARR
jgi:uncharacterized membrane protein YczE